MTKTAPVRLTPRQQEILSLIWDGHTTTDIAETLTVSARTVEVHRFHMMKKLRVTNLAQLLRAGLEHGMITLKR
ncbi:MAG: LuxR C-terminal-related transcriptional regulator [Nitrospiraceae bacterium]